MPTKEEREAKKAKARKEAELNLTARRKSDDAFRSNYGAAESGTARSGKQFLSSVAAGGCTPCDSEGLQLRLGGLLRLRASNERTA